MQLIPGFYILPYALRFHQLNCSSPYFNFSHQLETGVFEVLNKARPISYLLYLVYILKVKC